MSVVDKADEMIATMENHTSQLMESLDMLRDVIDQRSEGSFLGKDFEEESCEWLIGEIDKLTDEVISMSPSEWAEENRYLPDSVTRMPGFYNYDLTPYLREIVDCLDIRSPVREINVMKGGQVGCTVGVLENGIGYVIEVVKSAACMMVTADDGLAKLRAELYLTPMVQQSGLEDLIQSNDEKASHKTGKTDRKWEWRGGGSLIMTGAHNPNAARSLSIRFMFKDEPDGWILRTPQGDPDALFDGRTDTYETTRKILNLSTPLLEENSRINRKFKEGDQRFYNVPCKKCGMMQVLDFWQHDAEKDYRWGLVYEVTEKGNVVEGSVRYKCKDPDCAHLHSNDDKTWMFARGEWIATAEPKVSTCRSYHLSALYAPAFAKSWEACVIQYLQAWDVNSNRPHDAGLFQVFRNSVLGKTYVERGEGVRFDQVSAHRRPEYHLGEVPNIFAAQFTGGAISVLTCAVDVQEDDLAVAVFGWGRGHRCFLIDYWRFEGDTTNLENEATWGRLAMFIENQVYTADDGQRYGIETTFIDAGFNMDLVLSFCQPYTQGVSPIIGRPIKKGQTIQEFRPWETKAGTHGYMVNVDLYKDRWAVGLRKHWDGMSEQPFRFFNAPVDTTDKQLTELTKEVKKRKIDKQTGAHLGFEWYRASGGSAPNELWDLIMYNNAAIDVIAWDVCRNQFDMERVDWDNFWTYMDEQRLANQGA